MPFPAVCACEPFFSFLFMCVGFLGPSKASPTTYLLGTPFLLVKDSISLRIPFSFKILSHPQHCSHFSHFIETETAFDASSTTESMLHIATSLSAQCLLSLHSYFIFFYFLDSRSKKEHKYKEIDIQIPTFGATVAIMCI